MSTKLAGREIPQDASHAEKRASAYQPDPLSTLIAGKNFTRPTLMRRDLASEKAVDVGIGLQEVLGTRDAALFLKNNVIGIDVALRVLLHPGQRRSV
jgi:hypothetical protein